MKISVASGKGDTGKTLVATSLAASQVLVVTEPDITGEHDLVSEHLSLARQLAFVRG